VTETDVARTPAVITRRGVLRAGLGVAAAGVGSRLLGTAPASAAAAALPTPATSGIDHIVVVMMENRSFDHFLGWLPGANGRQAGLTYTDPAGVRHSTHHLTDYQGCAHPDPDHSFRGGRVAFNGGACDGWLRAGANDQFVIGYYEASDLAFFRSAARQWTVFDRYFAATMAPTFPNRLYQHSAQTDRTDGSSAQTSMPTIWDRLADAGVSRRYYFSDVPFLALYGAKYLPIAAHVTQFFSDAAAGRLPAVSFVEPRFVDEASGSSSDDHPRADIRAGQAFLNSVYRAVTTGPAWSRTALVVNYDEWGGFFDHVPPGTAPDARPDLGTGQRGFRVPCLLISPRARRGYVAHGTYDHASVLKMIEWRFGLRSLTPRDAAAANLAEVLDFSRAPDLSAPAYAVAPFVGLPCQAGGEVYEEWRALAQLAASVGWRIGG
jgi:phospholipase C